LSVLVVIPAKGTSRRIPGKNVRPLAGTPLFLWTVRAALQSEIGEVVVSTENEWIAELSEREGAHVVQRPPHLARDPMEAPDVALHALEVVEYGAPSPETVVMLLPTSPFRTAAHVQEAYALHTQTPGRPNVLSVTDAPEIERKLHRIEGQGWMAAERLSGRVLLNGAIWIAPAERLKRDGYFSGDGAIPYRMDAGAGLDIDTPADWTVAKWLAGRRAA
jgi:CMP-N,N'-diacetyllegionaminic acid synthase